MAQQLVPPRPKLVPLEQRLKAKIAAQRTIAVAPPPGTRLTVTVEEAAELLGISRDIAFREIRAGTIPALRLGASRIVVPVQGLLDLVEEACQRAATARKGNGTAWPSARRNTPPKTGP